MGDGEEEIVVPKGWEVKYSQSKEPGRPYYVRVSDGHRQWDPPHEYNWEVIVAVVILAAVGLYPSSGDTAESGALLTHGGCTCAPWTVGEVATESTTAVTCSLNGTRAVTLMITTLVMVDTLGRVTTRSIGLVWWRGMDIHAQWRKPMIKRGLGSKVTTPLPVLVVNQ